MLTKEENSIMPPITCFSIPPRIDQKDHTHCDRQHGQDRQEPPGSLSSTPCVYKSIEQITKALKDQKQSKQKP